MFEALSSCQRGLGVREPFLSSRRRNQTIAPVNQVCGRTGLRISNSSNQEVEGIGHVVYIHQPRDWRGRR